jgi:V/A-type H+-transporting ATPase subunit K
MLNLGLLGAGLVMGLSALGSGLGIGIAGSSTIGVWKKSYMRHKPASMLLLAFVGAPMTQVFYGYILMGQIKAAAIAYPENGWLYIGFGLASGLGIAFSAVGQGMAAAASADAQGETGKGFAQYMLVVGIAETVALFSMVLSMVSL